MQLWCIVLSDTWNHVRVEDILEGHLRMPHAAWGQIGAPAKQVVQGMLHTDPNKRLTLEQVLRSKFMTGASETTPITGLPARHKEVEFSTNVLSALVVYDVTKNFDGMT